MEETKLIGPKKRLENPIHLLFDPNEEIVNAPNSWNLIVQMKKNMFLRKN